MTLACPLTWSAPLTSRAPAWLKVKAPAWKSPIDTKPLLLPVSVAVPAWPMSVPAVIPAVLVMVPPGRVNRPSVVVLDSVRLGRSMTARLPDCVLPFRLPIASSPVVIWPSDRLDCGEKVSKLSVPTFCELKATRPWPAPVVSVAS